MESYRKGMPLVDRVCGANPSDHRLPDCGRPFPGRTDWHPRLDACRPARRRHAHQESQKKAEETISTIKTNLTSLKGILDSINDEDTLTTMETSDPLVLNIKQDIETLAANKAQELTQKLEQIFKERLLSIQFSKESG